MNDHQNNAEMEYKKFDFANNNKASKPHSTIQSSFISLQLK